MDLFDRFNADKCTLCGECFHQCPVMHLPLEVAKAEIVRLTSWGKPLPLAIADHIVITSLRRSNPIRRGFAIMSAAG